MPVNEDPTVFQRACVLAGLQGAVVFLPGAFRFWSLAYLKIPPSKLRNKDGVVQVHEFIAWLTASAPQALPRSDLKYHLQVSRT